MIWKKLGILAGISLSVVGCTSEKDPGMEFIDLRVEDITSDSAAVRFQTSRESSCVVEYGLSADVLDLSATDLSMGEDNPFDIDHDVPLFDLLADTEYFYRATVVDPEGREYFSEVFSFDTLVSTDLRPNLSESASVLSVSSNWNGGANDSSFGANQAIDGSMSTEWASDGEGDDAWLELSWEAEQPLTGVRVRSREMTDGTSIVSSFQLVVGADVLGPFDTPDPSQSYTFDFGSPVMASQVRFEVLTSTGGNTGLREIQLLGQP